jgi:hypothetical protein
MRRIRNSRRLVVGLFSLATLGMAACSAQQAPSGAGSGTGHSATPAATANASSPALPATTSPGTATSAVVVTNGIEMTVSSTPRVGVLGSATIEATVNLTGAVPAGTLDFVVGIGPADQGQASSDEELTIAGPGTYQMPSGYTPTQRGAWALTVNFWNQQGLTMITATGMAANATSSSPYPQLVTVVS